MGRLVRERGGFLALAPRFSLLLVLVSILPSDAARARLVARDGPFLEI